ncbi:unnamed protein product [Rhizoctonia solani]|uniref:GmrSD restriction endonucleases C-terminal domain-containing protein n=1 Tax=Rhizoctonia solani TaxID=456999 RepID=A0A8H3DE93_9AGAM|nr:unnamed protein product [Rhizoctonia solani]
MWPYSTSRLGSARLIQAIPQRLSFPRALSFLCQGPALAIPIVGRMSARLRPISAPPILYLTASSRKDVRAKARLEQQLRFLRRAFPRLSSPIMRLASLLGLAAVGRTQTIGRRGNLPDPVDVATAKRYLDELTVATPVTEPAYDRKMFKHWVTISGKCNTREIVLKRDATVEVMAVDSEYKPTAGSWLSDYDGHLITAPADSKALPVDVDHIVPLKEAWQAGAWEWTAEKRKRFANDFNGSQLLAVSTESNRKKGDKDPSKWMPSNPAFRCKYIRAWIQVKHEYGLTVGEAEKAALTKYINEC